MAERLTAMDIEQQVFARRLRGLDPDEVSLFLRAVAGEVERLNLDQARLAEENGQLQAELAELRGREKTLQHTLVTAQGVADELRRQADRQAELILAEARLRGERVVAEAQARLLALEARVEALKLERQRFERRLRQTIDEHLGLLDRTGESAGAGGMARELVAEGAGGAG